MKSLFAFFCVLLCSLIFAQNHQAQELNNTKSESNSELYMHTINLSTDAKPEAMSTDHILLRSNDYFEIWGLESETSAADTIISILSANYNRISDSLGINLSSLVVINVYHELDALHDAINMPDLPDWVVGVAIGSNQIGIVSPYNPGPVHSFESILKVTVHELVHCFVNELADNSPIPLWINEGTATFLAYQNYQSEYLCSYINDNNGEIPGLNELNDGNTFGNVGGYSFSYSIAEFIISCLGGSDALSQFIASGTDYSTLGYQNELEFQQEWMQYLYCNYACDFGGFQAAFAADNKTGLLPHTVQFTDYSISDDGPITNWAWDFDNDGNFDSYDENPSWTYTNAGTYSVSLTVSDGTEYSTYTKNNYIKANMPLDFAEIPFFGTDNSIEIVSWNIEFFPLMGDTTMNYLSQIIPTLDADIIAFQEIHDTIAFRQTIDNTPGYDAYISTTDDWLKLAYAYKTSEIQVNDVYEIYTSWEYYLPFLRRPFVFDIMYNSERYIIINNHFKAMGDGVLDTEDPNDEENRRWVATNLLVDYINTNFPNEKVILVGDFNDIITDYYENNVFQSIINNSASFAFADHDIATGPESEWSYPDYPSHIDHIIISNELFDDFHSHGSTTQTLKIEDCFPNGWADYTSLLSDHRPLAIKLFNDETLLFNKDFEDQSITSGGWTVENVIGEQTWYAPPEYHGHNGSFMGKISGYNNGFNECESWLISPEFSPENNNNLYLSFWNTSAYTGPGLELYWSDDYIGNVESANWTLIEDVNWHSGEPHYYWTYSGFIDLNDLTGSVAHLAFKYTSTTTSAATWELDDIILSNAVNIFDVNVSTNNDGGTATGSGIYSYGESVSLSASAEPGYTFINWTENGMLVSTEEQYTFTAIANRSLTANFELYNAIEASENIEVVSIYPNPSHGDFVIKMEDCIPADIHLYDIQGRLILEKHNVNETLFNFTIHGEKGIYVLEIRNQNETIRYKLIKN